MPYSAWKPSKVEEFAEDFDLDTLVWLQDTNQDFKDYLPGKKCKTRMTRLTKDSAAYKLLAQKFDDGEIEPADRPKEVWLTEEVFQQHKLDNFRTAFNKMKAQKGILLRDDDGKPSIADAIAQAQGKSVEMMDALKPPPEAAGVASLPTTTFVTPAGRRNDSQRLEVDFLPFHVCAEVDDTDYSRKVLACAVQLPSGTKSVDDIEVAVVNDGSVFEMKSVMHPLMLNSKVLTVVWSSFVSPKDHTLRQAAFGLAVRNMLNGEKKDVWGVWQKALPFKCDNLFLKNEICVVRDCHFLYVELQAADVTTYATNRKAKAAVDYSDKIEL